MNKRTWWKAAAALIVGGVGVAFADSPKVEQAVWSRASTPAPVPAAIPAPVVSSAPVIPAAASIPVTKPETAPAIPTTPSYPLPPKSSSDSVVLPEFKAVPQPKPVIPAATLPPIVMPPTTTSAKVPVIVAPPIPDVPKPIPPAVEIVPPSILPVPKVAMPEPVKPALPAIPEIAPPAQPVKSADPVKPLPPMLPDFNLRPAPSGNSVKTDGANATVPQVPVIPPAFVIPPPPEAIPPVASATRPKPVDGPMPPTDKYVFPIPEKAAPVEVTIAKPVPPPAIPPTLPKVEMPEVPAVPPRSLPGVIPPVPMILPGVPTSIERPVLPKPEHNTIPTPGVDPMNLKQKTMAAAIGTALALMPASPVFSADPVPKTVDEKLVDAQKEIKRLGELLDGRKESDGKASPFDVGAVKEIAKLKDDVFSLKEKVASLENQLSEMKKSTSLKPAPATPALTGKGTVRIENDYPVEITIVVNAMSYRVPATTKLDIPVPVGEFTYQLLNSGANLAPTKSPIGEKELVKLRIK